MNLRRLIRTHTIVTMEIVTTHLIIMEIVTTHTMEIVTIIITDNIFKQFFNIVYNKVQYYKKS